LIVTEFDPRHGRCSLIVESADDLWTLRRLIRRGDVVVSRSSRVVKNEGEFTRPDKGERVKVTIALSVEEIHLDRSIERVRLRGKIIESSDETVGKAGSHSLTLSPGHSLSIKKERWSPLDMSLVDSSKASGKRFLLVAADRREAGVGYLSGSHLSVLTTVESGAESKIGEEKSQGPYFTKVAEVVSQVARPGDEIAVAGPGNTKNVIANRLTQTLAPSSVHVVEGFDLTGSDGVRLMVKHPGFQALARGTALVEMQQLVQTAIRMVSQGDAKVVYAIPRVKEAAEAGAVDSCVVSDDVFSTGVDEDSLVEVLNTVERKGGSVFLADSSLETGKRISAFGGILAILRYAIRPY